MEQLAGQSISLVDLPDDLLARILHQMPDAADRCRLEACSRATAAASRRTSWPRLSISLASDEQAKRVSAWLAGRQPDVRRLHVERDPRNYALEISGGITLPSLPRLEEVCTFQVRMHPHQLEALLAHRSSLTRVELVNNNSFSALPAALGALPALRSLAIRGLSQWPDPMAGWRHLDGLSALTELDLSRSSRGAHSFERHFDLLHSMPALERLELGCCTADDIFQTLRAAPPPLEPHHMEALQALTRLTHLGLWYCGLECPAELAVLSRLRSLGVSETRFSRWEGLTALSQLTSLVLRSCGTEAQPAQLPPLWPALRALQLFACRLASWDFLQGCKQLTSLISELCYMPRLPAEVGCMAALQRLQVEGCYAAGMEFDWGVLKSLSRLTSLEVHCCGKLIVSPEAAALSSLRELTLDFCLMSRSAEAEESLRHLADLPRLTALALTSSNFSGDELPPSITSLTHLRSLDLSLCWAASGWERLAALTHLTRLDLAQCPYLEVLPASITELQGLRALGLDNSAVAAGWEHLLALPHLTCLSLQGYGLTEPPPELSPLTSYARIRVGALRPYPSS